MSERKQYEIMALQAKDAFVQVAGKETFDKEIMFALQILRGSDYLQKCNPQSIKNAITNIALTGATLNPALQQAFLVPRSIKGQGMSCCLDFSYRGLVKIATDSGSVMDIEAVEVFAGDEFYYEKGLTPVLKHIPKIPRQAGASMTHVYAIATLHSGIKKFEVMTAEEVEKIRQTSQCPDSPAWKNFAGEMAKKTVVKRIYKLLPQTDRMGEALHVVNQHEGLDAKNLRSGSAERLMNKFDSAPEEAEFVDIPATESMPEKPEPSAEEKKKKADLKKQADKLTKKEEKKASPAKEEGNAKVRLKQLLSLFCGGDMHRMTEVLKEVSVFTGNDGKEMWIKSVESIDTQKDGWSGKALGKLKVKMQDEWKLPEGCLYKPEGCESADMSGPLAVCVRTGAECPFEEERNF